MSDIPIPARMQRLARDSRGLPIPAGVFIDSTGTPHFTVNDEATRQRHLAEDRCSICGSKLIGGRWFVGGARAAFHDHGTYFDPPSHDECAHYALLVCPWLAARHYRRVDERKRASRVSGGIVGVDITQIPDRPPVFVAVLARQSVLDPPYVKPLRPYMRIEYWRYGTQLDEAEGRAIVDQIMAAPLPPRQRPRLVTR